MRLDRINYIKFRHCCNICNYNEARMPTRCFLILVLIFFVSKWQCAPKASRSNFAYTTNACHLLDVPAIHQPVVVWTTVEDALLNISMKMVAKLTVLNLSTCKCLASYEDILLARRASSSPTNVCWSQRNIVPCPLFSLVSDQRCPNDRLQITWKLLYNLSAPSTIMST